MNLFSCPTKHVVLGNFFFKKIVNEDDDNDNNDNKTIKDLCIDCSLTLMQKSPKSSCLLFFYRDAFKSSQTSMMNLFCKKIAHGSHSLGGHTFSTQAKFSKELTFITP